jgi:hypothetical protein
MRVWTSVPPAASHAFNKALARLSGSRCAQAIGIDEDGRGFAVANCGGRALIRRWLGHIPLVFWWSRQRYTQTDCQVNGSTPGYVKDVRHRLR